MIFYFENKKIKYEELKKTIEESNQIKEEFKNNLSQLILNTENLSNYKLLKVKSGKE